jgi:hypothetical protein
MSFSLQPLITSRQIHFLILCQSTDSDTVFTKVSLESLQQFCHATLQECPVHLFILNAEVLPPENFFLSKEIMESSFSPTPTPFSDKKCLIIYINKRSVTGYTHVKTATCFGYTYVANISLGVRT